MAEPGTRNPERGTGLSRDVDALFGDHGAPALNRIGWIWVVYVVLFGLSIPWYLPADAPPRIWLGLPHWVVLSVAAVAGAAAFTVYVMSRYWPER